MAAAACEVYARVWRGENQLRSPHLTLQQYSTQNYYYYLKRRNTIKRIWASKKEKFTILFQTVH